MVLTEKTATLSADAVVVLAGDVGPADVRRLDRELEAVDDGARTVFDLQAVHSIDMLAVDPLVDSLELLRQRGVEVSVTPSWAEDVFRLTGRWLVEPRHSAVG